MRRRDWKRRCWNATGIKEPSPPPPPPPPTPRHFQSNTFSVFIAKQSEIGSSLSLSLSLLFLSPEWPTSYVSAMRSRTLVRQVKPENCASQLRFRAESIDTSGISPGEDHPRPLPFASLQSSQRLEGNKQHGRVACEGDSRRTSDLAENRNSFLSRSSHVRAHVLQLTSCVGTTCHAHRERLCSELQTFSQFFKYCSIGCY